MISNIPKTTLFVGNGINRAFGGVDWEAYIRKEAEKKANPYGLLEKLPYPLRIVAATDDQVNTSMKDFASELFRDIISDERKEYLEQILLFPAEDIITSNYSLELEQASGIPHRKNKYYAYRKETKECTERERQLRMYTYFDSGEYGKHIWHIHGDITTPSSIIMGHYYYGKLLHEIQNYIPSLIRRYKEMQKTNIPFEAKSWVDLFLTNNIHMFGFNMDVAEMDLWWLICCKKRNFPNTKITFYSSDMDPESEKALMMKMYGVEICDDIPLEKDHYLDYYLRVLDRIKTMTPAKT